MNASLFCIGPPFGKPFQSPCSRRPASCQGQGGEALPPQSPASGGGTAFPPACGAGLLSSLEMPVIARSLRRSNLAGIRTGLLRKASQ